MADEIIWEDPPETAQFAGQKPGRYKEFAAALRQNQGKWALLPGERRTADSAKGTALNIRNGRVQGFTKGEFETAIDGSKIYVRFLGSKDVPGQPQDGAEPDSASPDEGADADDDGGGEEALDTKKVRAWARANGFDLPDRGRMPSEVHAAYRKAHAAYERPSAVPEQAEPDQADAQTG